MKIIYRTSCVATTFKISLEDYIELIMQSYITYDSFLKTTYNSIVSMDEEQAGTYLKTLIMRICYNKEGEVITNNFMEELNKHIKKYNKLTNIDDQISYCQNLIGGRNAVVLRIMLESYYKM